MRGQSGRDHLREIIGRRQRLGTGARNRGVRVVGAGVGWEARVRRKMQSFRFCEQQDG